MRAHAGSGKQLSISYKLGKDFLLHAQLQMKGLSGLFSPQTNTMDVDWEDKCRQQEMGFTFENRYATLTYHNADGGTDHLNETTNRSTG